MNRTCPKIFFRSNSPGIEQKVAHLHKRGASKALLPLPDGGRNSHVRTMRQTLDGVVADLVILISIGETRDRGRKKKA